MIRGWLVGPRTRSPRIICFDGRFVSRTGRGGTDFEGTDVDSYVGTPPRLVDAFVRLLEGVSYE